MVQHEKETGPTFDHRRGRAARVALRLAPPQIGEAAARETHHSDNEWTLDSRTSAVFRWITARRGLLASGRHASLGSGGTGDPLVRGMSCSRRRSPAPITEALDRGWAHACRSFLGDGSAADFLGERRKQAAEAPEEAGTRGDHDDVYRFSVNATARAGC